MCPLPRLFFCFVLFAPPLYMFSYIKKKWFQKACGIEYGLTLLMWETNQLC